MTERVFPFPRQCQSAKFLLKGWRAAIPPRKRLHTGFLLDHSGLLQHALSWLSKVKENLYLGRLHLQCVLRHLIQQHVTHHNVMGKHLMPP